MKNILSKILKIFLIILVVVLISLLIFGLVLYLDLPWWVGLFILLAVIGLYIGFLFMRKIWSRNREKHFVQQVIEQDADRLKTMKGHEREELNALQDKWKDGIEALKRSHLRKQGNPLYVLPWYLVIGESGSGKTTSINSARLSSPFAEVSRTSGISGTKNCDWWFFEQAIILDTAGRWTIPIDEGKDKEEWRKFLNLLVKFRKREPLNGVIVTIAADKLLEAQPEALEEDGRNIRLRVDELMRSIGFKFPIYLLITKCDLIQGMTQFCDQLPEGSLDQPMGVINQDLSTDIEDFQERAFNTIGERLRNIRLLLLHQSESKDVDPSLLLFPEEFKNMKSGLVSFMRGAFQENPYQETSILRGLFFSSGQQEGTPFSHFLNVLGLIGEKEVLPGTSKGLFLHDFFSKILPKDRGIFTPTKRSLEWSAITRNLGLASLLILCVAFCGMLSFSFVKNMKVIRDVPREFTRHIVFQEENQPDILSMDRFRKAILRMESQNLNWWFPRFGMNESIKVEIKLKAKYCKLIKTQFLEDIDDEERANYVISDLFRNLTPKNYGLNIAHLVDRINILQARLEDESPTPDLMLEKIRNMDQPFLVNTIFFPDLEQKPVVREQLSSLYLYYLAWSGQDDVNLNNLNREMKRQQELLVAVLMERNNMDWVTDWVNASSLEKVTLAEFWQGSRPVSTETDIPFAYTLKGKEMIDASLDEIITATRDKLNFDDMVLAYNKKYRQDYIRAWQDFGDDFHTGAGSLNGKEEWRQVTARIEREQGPYFTLLDRMSKELKVINDSLTFSLKTDIPEWVKKVYLLEKVKNHKSIKLDTSSGSGIISRNIEKGKKLIDKLKGEAGQLYDGNAFMNIQEAADAFNNYRSALNKIALESSSTSLSAQRKAFDMMRKAFSDDPAINESSQIMVAESTISNLKSIMGGRNFELKMFWRLVGGPLDHMKTYVNNETACYLQKQWRKAVLKEIDYYSGIEKISHAQDRAVDFINKGEASPFVTWEQLQKFIPKAKYEREIPFTENFLSFITSSNKRMRQSQKTGIQSINFDIAITPVPTDPTPRVHVSKTILTLRTPKEDQVLTFENYPTRKTFNWSQATGRNVTLHIEIVVNQRVRYTLEKHYKSFPEFLMDFRHNKRSFRPADFPKESKALINNGIMLIKIEYYFDDGKERIIDWYERYMRLINIHVPELIVECWDQ